MSNISDKPNFRTRWVLWRNALLGNASFQAWAARMPLFRTVARRHAARHFDLVAGFVYSQILSAFVETDLIGFLDGQLRSLDAVMAHIGMGEEAALRLLRAGQALELSESPQSGLWTLGAAGAAMSANAGAMAMVRHHKLLYADLADPVALLRADRQQQTALSAYWTYASRAEGEGDTTGYSALMAATQPMVIQQIVDAYPFHRHQRMLDIGGGSGSFAAAIRNKAPSLKTAILDLPDVIAEATARLGGDGSIELHPGSFRDDPLPTGYDLISVVRILHDHDDAVVEALLAKIHAVLPPDGRLLIVEPMAGVTGATRMGDAYFGLYLWAMGSGRPRSQQEYRQMLQKAGFARVQDIPTNLPLIASALVAQP